MTNHSYEPVPGAIKEGAWSIKNYPGSHYIEGKTMYIDTSSTDDFSKYCRSMSMVTTKFASSWIDKKHSDPILGELGRAYEAARCQFHGARRGIKLFKYNINENVKNSCIGSPSLVGTIAEFIKYNGFARGLSDSLVEIVQDKYDITMDSRVITQLESIHWDLSSGYANKGITIHCARRTKLVIEGLIEKNESRKEREAKKNSNKGELDEEGTSNEECKADEALEKLMDNARSSIINNPSNAKDLEDDGWCELKFNRPRLNTPHRGVMAKSPRPRPADSGVILKYSHRYATDGKVFARKKVRGAKYTVLIDGSGSMSIELSDIHEIMRQCPGAQVAVYNQPSFRDTPGTLHIIANNGKCIDKLEYRMTGGGNGVDGPALEWLSTQKGPKIWVSDGFVHGKLQDTYNFNLIKHCIDLKKAHKIKQFYSLPDAVEVIKRANKKGFSRRESGVSYDTIQ